MIGKLGVFFSIAAATNGALHRTGANCRPLFLKKQLWRVRRHDPFGTLYICTISNRLCLAQIPVDTGRVSLRLSMQGKCVIDLVDVACHQQVFDGRNIGLIAFKRQRGFNRAKLAYPASAALLPELLNFSFVQAPPKSKRIPQGSLRAVSQSINR